MNSLKGIRVVDLGIITAGAATSALLADMGAEVIKIESASYQDPFRVWAGVHGASPFFRATNRNKLGVSLDLKVESDRRVFLDLISQSDVVVENFRRGALEKLGLGYSALIEKNPNIIMASISSQGMDGPLSQYVSFGSTLEAMSGMAALTGNPAGAPMVSGEDLNYPDQVVALFAAGMICSALLARENDGGGVHLDLSQRELTSFLCGEFFLDDNVFPESRRGFSDPLYFSQDVLQANDNRWVAISIPDSRQHQALNDLLEDLTLKDWVASLPSKDIVNCLRALDIPSTVVLRGNEAVDQAVSDGSPAFLQLGDFWVKGTPFIPAGGNAVICKDAPDLGEDNETVLGNLCNSDIVC